MIAVQLLLIVDLMEKKQVIHRDIKPSNIMIDMNQLAKANEEDDGEGGPAIFDVKLIDFGCAMRLLGGNKPIKKAAEEEPSVEERTSQALVLGTPGFIAPESADGKSYTNKYDIYSIGSCLFSILTHYNLWEAQNFKDLL